jgi:RNA 2',3'-cyclic 3'-phosphodiesterase
MIRLFVAVDLPESVRRDLAAICAGIPAAKWVKPEQMHLTVRFIGEVDGGLFEDIATGLGGVVLPEMELRVAGVGSFGDRRGANVLWAGITPVEAVTRLHDKIEGVLTRIGVERDRRKFHPHVTLARLNGAPDHRVAKFLGDHAMFRSAPFAVREFQLYSSFLAQSGAIHRVEAEYPLDEIVPLRLDWTGE